ncbi:MAG: carbohydrate kinase family protein [Lachnospiraceae bacterium]|nr:carbohydrate kinase family protein [Lachnospiraceae bacterium]MBQ5360903.1 carbohydrate kinase family protein [Lachnospiraceae bacterium]
MTEIRRKKHGIIVTGATFVDVKGYPLGTYLPGGRNAGTVVQVHGGVSRNIAEDIANLELRPTYLTILDRSGISTDVRTRLEKHKVDMSYTQYAEKGLGMWLAVFDSDGEVTASISQRPDLLPMCSLLDEKGDEIFSEADSVTLEVDMDPRLIKRILALAEKYEIPAFAVVSNMTIAVERRELFQRTACFVCNQQEAGIYFADDFGRCSPEGMLEVLKEKVKTARIPRIVVTMGGQGSVYASETGESGIVPAFKVDVVDTTGAGDAFFAGVTCGLTYGKSLKEACEIGTRVAASVLMTKENVCPRFRPEEFGIAAPDRE